MLTSLCAIASLISVGHYLFMCTVFFDPKQCRSSSPLTLSYTYVSISCWADVRANGSCDVMGPCLSFPVYCNSLLGTLNIRKVIRERGHGDVGISLRPIGDSNSSNTDSRKVDGSVCFTRSLPPLTQSSTQARDIEAKIADVEDCGPIAGTEAHGGNVGHQFLNSRSQIDNGPRMVWIESGLESGPARRLRRAS